MVSTAAHSEDLHETSLRRAQVKHAVKTALGCCVATVLAFYFHVPSGEFAPLFAYLLMTLGMPSPRLNWLLSQFAIVGSAMVSALVLVAFWSAPPLYLAMTLVWIFTCVLFENWFPLPATLGAMVSALGIFVFYQGGVGAALSFYVDYAHNFLIAGFSVVVVHTLLWQLNTRKVFLERLAAVFEERRWAAALQGASSLALILLASVSLSVSGFNLTNHFNPLDVHSNIDDPRFGVFFGNHKRRFLPDFDVIF